VLGALALAITMGAGASAALGSERSSAGRRTADRVIERRLRGAIRSDPLLTLAATRVKVTSRDGIVRVVGRVGSAKERSSIVFKARQNAPGGRVDDRVTIGDGIERTAW